MLPGIPGTYIAHGSVSQRHLGKKSLEWRPTGKRLSLSSQRLAEKKRNKRIDGRQSTKYKKLSCCWWTARRSCHLKM